MNDNLSKKDLTKMSAPEQRQFIVAAKKKIKETKAEIARLKKVTKETEKKTLKTKDEISRLKKDTQARLKEFGWDRLPENVLLWLRENYHKEWQYFRPPATAVLERYNERTSEKAKQLDLDPKFKGCEEMVSLNAWIEPDGTFHPMTDFAQHEEFASDYLFDKFGREGHRKMVGRKYNHQVLEEMGWIRVMTWLGKETSFSRETVARVTKRQSDTVRLFCSLHKLKTPTFLS